MYDIYLERTAEKDLRKLDDEVFRKVVAKIKELSGNPRPPGSRKITGAKSDWRIRIGTYRVIYEIDEDAKILRIMRIKHRREAYR